MSKNTTENEEKSTIEKFSHTLINFIGDLPPSTSRLLSARLNTFLDGINLGMTIERLTDENPNIPQYRVRIAALVGTTAATAISGSLEAAITSASLAIIAATRGTATPFVLAAWSESQFVVAEQLRLLMMLFPLLFLKY